MTEKQKKYLAIGVGVLILCLLIIAALHWAKGDTTVASGATAAALAIASAAAGVRQKTRTTVEAAKTQGEQTGEAIKENLGKAKEDMKAVGDEVATASRDQKETDGENLLKPGGGS